MAFRAWKVSGTLQKRAPDPVVHKVKPLPQVNHSIIPGFHMTSETTEIINFKFLTFVR